MTPLLPLNTTVTEAVGVMASLGRAAIDAAVAQPRPTKATGPAELVGVKADMFRLSRHKLEVLGSVVEAVTVDVVNFLFGRQPSSKGLFHDEAVFLNVTAGGHDETVTALQVGAALPPPIAASAQEHGVAAAVGTEVPGADLTRAAAELGAAGFAS